MIATAYKESLGYLKNFEPVVPMFPLVPAPRILFAEPGMPPEGVHYEYVSRLPWREPSYRLAYNQIRQSRVVLDTFDAETTAWNSRNSFAYISLTRSERWKHHLETVDMLLMKLAEYSVVVTHITIISRPQFRTQIACYGNGPNGECVKSVALVEL